MGGVRAVLLAACAVAFAGCSGVSPASLAADDPFEPTNRTVYRFDERFDQYVVIPAAGFYLYYMPPPTRHGLHNVLTNLDLPVTFTNQLLQGQIGNAGSTLGRFVINSSFGLGGLVDLGTPAGLPYRPADFGQTLGRWGVPEGPFLVLPFIGPDPPRDLLGDGVDILIDPLFYLPPGAPLYERAVVTVALRAGSPFEVHARNIVLRRELEKGSVDPYVTMRSVYRQLREEEIGPGLPPEVTDEGAK